MLARTNRLVSADDYRRLVRRGRRVNGTNTIVYVSRAGAGPSRFGFIVPKTVGVAVTRNTVRRRLKAMSRELLPAVGDGIEIVVRALPGAAQVDWVTLRAEVTQAVGKGVGLA
ncbi:MAG: ribonuclease P protein component [Actinomycetota bacterium]